MIAIFEFGTLWFWVLIVVVSGLIMAVQERAESPGGWTTFWVAITFLILYCCGADMSIKEFGLHIYHYPLETLVYFLLYVVAGTIWSFYKWREAVKECVERYKVDMAKYAKISGAYSMPLIKNYKPEVNKNKGELFNWIFYWPFSLAWFILHEPVERIFDAIMNTCRKIYEGIADRAFSKVDKPIKAEDPLT